MNKETTQQEENTVHRLPVNKIHRIFIKDLVRAYPGYYFKLYCSGGLYDPATYVEVLALKGDTE